MSNARIVVVNPNSTEAVTCGIDDAVAPLRRDPGVRIDCLTLAEGPPGIETQCHADSVVGPLCALLRREEAETDAFVIACFGDPGLHSAREATRRPVFGIAECGYLLALTLGERFGVIAILPASVTRQKRYVRQLGLSERYAASLPVGLGVTALEGDAVVDRLVETGRRLVEDRGADVLILGCAGMARYRSDVERALGVPVVEPCQAAAAQALGAVRFGYSTAPRANRA